MKISKRSALKGLSAFSIALWIDNAFSADCPQNLGRAR
jgi:hypothetical protein